MVHIIVWLVTVLCLVAAVGLSVFSLANYTDTLPVLHNDTISIPFRIPSWAPPYIDLQLTGPNDNCTASAIALRCHDIVNKSTIVTQSSIHDYIYLAQSSKIYLDPSSSGVQETTNYHIWLFDSIMLAHQAVENNFTDMHCSSKNHCVHKKVTVQKNSADQCTFNIKKPSYYFIRCENKCPSIDKIIYDTNEYNFTASAKLANHSQTFKVQDEYRHLNLRNEYFPASVSMCALLTLDTTLCGDTPESKYFVNVRYVSPEREVLIYVLMVMGIAVVALFSINAYICCRMKKTKKLQARVNPLEEE